MAIRTVEEQVFHADGHTDMTKLAVAFRKFWNAPNTIRAMHKCLTAKSDELFLVCTRMSYIRNENPQGLCQGSGGQSPASRREGPASIPGQSMWDLCCTK
jgi:hypothetical protein